MNSAVSRRQFVGGAALGAAAVARNGLLGLGSRRRGGDRRHAVGRRVRRGGPGLRATPAPTRPSRPMRRGAKVLGLREGPAGAGALQLQGERPAHHDTRTTPRRSTPTSRSSAASTTTTRTRCCASSARSARTTSPGSPGRWGPTRPWSIPRATRSTTPTPPSSAAPSGFRSTAPTASTARATSQLWDEFPEIPDGQLMTNGEAFNGEYYNRCQAAVKEREGERLTVWKGCPGLRLVTDAQGAVAGGRGREGR